ncbi:hypothetical protein [Chryseobacterium gambrini]|uniref:hypothetical protein n=1 Tax=Chryseobacterium gambrini TaxID=373672 RepID=UPI0022F1697C|nr:hypothetical protein [Chryseobacterium gambrini]WBV50714.1 hypothetical protein PFY09_10210 [Chryseobacterium gambrini]
MKTLISLIATLGYISAIACAVYFIIIFIKKILYYPPNVKEKVYEEIMKLSYISGLLLVFSSTCFWVAKEIVEYDFKSTLRKHTIVSAEIENIFFSQEDMRGIFDHFENDEGRYRCESFSGIINLDNNESISVEIIKHCYEKNRYIIVSKQYSVESTIGDINTDKFDYLKKNIDSIQ